MTEAQIELLAKPQWYDGRKRAWSPADLKEAYELHNKLTGQNKRDQGCGSCRRAVIQTLQHQYQLALKENEGNEGNEGNTGASKL